MAPRLSPAAEAVRFFRAALRRAARPDRAKAEKAYLKSELRFLGAGQPAIRAAVLDYCRTHAELSARDLRAIAEALYETEVHELRSAAIGVLECRREALTDRDLPWLIDLVRRSNTWAHVDWIAPKVIGDVLARYPSSRRSMDQWARDESFWVRRGALLAEHDALRAGGGDFKRWARLAGGMLDEREFFIRKAIGWVLREVSKKRPALTFGFLREHRGRVSRLSLQEGAKYLPTHQRRALGLEGTATHVARARARRIPRLAGMPRIAYVGQGNNFRRLLNHSPELSAAYWEVRRALNEGVLSPKLRMLSFLASDLANRCRY